MSSQAVDDSNRKLNRQQLLKMTPKERVTAAPPHMSPDRYAPQVREILLCARVTDTPTLLELSGCVRETLLATQFASTVHPKTHALPRHACGCRPATA